MNIICMLSINDVHYVSRLSKTNKSTKEGMNQYNKSYQTQQMCSLSYILAQKKEDYLTCKVFHHFPPFFIVFRGLIYLILQNMTEIN